MLLASTFAWAESESNVEKDIVKWLDNECLNWALIISCKSNLYKAKRLVFLLNNENNRIGNQDFIRRG